MNILKLTPEEVIRLSKTDFYADLNSEEILHILTSVKAYWQHSGSPDEPHAKLRSGLHSNGFVNTMEALKYPNLCSVFAAILIRRLRELYELPINGVIGPGNAAITLAYEVARQLGDGCWAGFTEKDAEGNPTICKRVRPKGETVLVLTELMTTASGSAQMCKTAVEKVSEDCAIVPYVPALIHRSKDLKLTNGTPVLPIFHVDIDTYNPDDCPLCKAGSKVVAPKSLWDDLVV